MASKEPDLPQFESISWCADLLKDPDFIITSTTSREYKSNTEDAFISETLNSEDAIAACLTMYKRPATPQSRIDEVRMLLKLGSRVSGHPYTCHGGLISTVLDEVMAVMLSVNRHVTKYIKTSTATASLKVTFLKPVRIPAAILVTAYFIQTQGRKHFLESDIKDADGVVLAKAEGLWLALKDSQRNL